MASRVGEVPTVLEGGRFGLMLEPGDVDSMADIIFKVLAKPDEAAKMAAAARDHVREHYSQEARTEQIIEVYKGVL